MPTFETVEQKNCGVMREGGFDIEASEVEMTPGFFPDQIEFVCIDGYVAMLDLDEMVKDREGNVEAARYEGQTADARPLVLEIYND